MSWRIPLSSITDLFPVMREMRLFESEKQIKSLTLCDIAASIAAFNASASAISTVATTSVEVEPWTSVAPSGFKQIHPNPPAPCPCPLRQAWGSLDALIGRLRAAFEENGGKPETNPFGARAVRLYLREVRDTQSKARGVSYEKKKRKRPVPTLSASSSSAVASHQQFQMLPGTSSTTQISKLEK